MFYVGDPASKVAKIEPVTRLRRLRVVNTNRGGKSVVNRVLAIRKFHRNLYWYLLGSEVLIKWRERQLSEYGYNPLSNCNGVTSWYENNMVVRSELNGNNGEATNTDDLAARNDAQKRMFKEARNKQFSKNGGKKSKVQNGPPECVVQEVTEDSVVQEPEGVRLIGCLGNEQNQMRYVWNGFNFICIDDFDFPDYRQYVYGECDSKGYFLDTDNQSLVKMRMFDTIFLGEFWSMGAHVIINRDIEYVPLILNMLRSQIGIPAGDRRNVTAIQRYLLKTFTTLPQEILMNTCFVYMYEIRVHYDIKTDFGLSCGMVRFVGSSWFGRSFFKISPKKCTFPLDYEFNNKWRVVKKKKCDVKFEGERMVRYPTFTTRPVGPSKWMIHGFCRFMGWNNFVYYDIKGEEFAAAVSRLWKKRANDSVLTSNQLKYLRVNDNADHASLFHCALERGDDEGILLTTRFGNRYDIPQIDPVVAERINGNFRLASKLGVFNLLYKKLVSLGFEVYDFLTRSMRMVYENGYKYIYDVICDPLYRHFDTWVKLGLMVKLPMPKRQLYMTWFESRFDKIYSDDRFDWILKLKKEPGKMGKCGRLYANAEEHTLYDCLSPMLLKEGLKQEYSVRLYNGVVFYIFSANAQDVESSNSLYRYLLSKKENCICYIHQGDDGFTMTVFNRCVRLYETDISSCDSSIGVGITSLAHTMISRLVGRETADRVLAQLGYDARFNNPCNEEEYLLMRPETCMLYSGHRLTSILGGLGNAVIGHEVARHYELNNDVDGYDFKNSLHAGAEEAGFILTVDERKNWNSITFLKRAFNGKVSWLVYGCIFRSLGVVEGMLCGEMFGITNSKFRSSSNEELFEIHLKQRVSSLVNEPGSIIINALRRRVGLSDLDVEVTIEDIIQRYGGEEYEYHELCYEIENLTMGQIVHGLAICRIFEFDYGVKKGVKVEDEIEIVI